jgi:hypothetical protein
MIVFIVAMTTIALATYSNWFKWDNQQQSDVKDYGQIYASYRLDWIIVGTNRTE